MHKGITAIFTVEVYTGAWYYDWDRTYNLNIINTIGGIKENAG